MMITINIWSLLVHCTASYRFWMFNVFPSYHLTYIDLIYPAFIFMPSLYFVLSYLLYPHHCSTARKTHMHYLNILNIGASDRLARDEGVSYVQL